MNYQDLKNSKDYMECVEKIKGYRRGFTFTINYSNIPARKANALKFILKNCCEMNLIESTSMGIALNGDLAEETFRRI